MDEVRVEVVQGSQPVTHSVRQYFSLEVYHDRPPLIVFQAGPAAVSVAGYLITLTRTQCC